MRLEDDKKDLQCNLKEALDALKSQQEKVVNPLIKEVAKREEENQRLLTEVRERTVSIKMLFAMMRSPHMCDLFYKTERKLYDKERLALLTQQSVFQLRQYQMSHENGEKFVESVYDMVNIQVINDYRDRSPAPTLASRRGTTGSPDFNKTLQPMKTAVLSGLTAEKDG